MKKYAKNIINPNFKNSVGCIVKGNPGILIHQLAHFIDIHFTSTNSKANNIIQAIIFIYLSKNLYGSLVRNHIMINHINTWDIFLIT